MENDDNEQDQNQDQEQDQDQPQPQGQVRNRSPIGHLMQNLTLDRSKIKDNESLIVSIGQELTDLIDLLASSIEMKNSLQKLFGTEDHPAVQHSYQIVLYVIQKIADNGWNLISLSSEGLVFSNSEGKVMSFNA